MTETHRSDGAEGELVRYESTAASKNQTQICRSAELKSDEFVYLMILLMFCSGLDSVPVFDSAVLLSSELKIANC